MRRASRPWTRVSTTNRLFKDWPKVFPDVLNAYRGSASDQRGMVEIHHVLLAPRGRSLELTGDSLQFGACYVPTASRTVFVCPTLTPPSTVHETRPQRHELKLPSGTRHSEPTTVIGNVELTASARSILYLPCITSDVGKGVLFALAAET
jgi:hypothetical protein